MKNKKGFTLIEVVAVVAILGILAILVFPQIFKSIENSKKKTYLSDADKLISKAQYVMKTDKTIQKPNPQWAIILGLDYLDEGDFNNPPNGGRYLPEYSFVAVGRYNYYNDFYYSVSLIEETKQGDYRGIFFLSKYYFDGRTDFNWKKSIDFVKVFTPNQLYYIEGSDAANIIESSQPITKAVVQNTFSTEYGGMHGETLDKSMWTGDDFKGFTKTYFRK